MSEDSIITISLETIAENLKILKSYCAPNVQQMAVVKANAYGHGLVPVAKSICEQVQWFAVNHIQEAVELRKNGIENPVLVFGVPTPNNAELYTKYAITATVSAIRHFDILEDGTDYHLNFDTGMGRLGFQPEQVEAVKEHVGNNSVISCTGIYSHFATADEPGSQKAKEQLRRFKKIRSFFPDNLLTHMCNTAATVQCRDAHFDLVRNGIGMYGYAPGRIEINDLEPALHWQTKLVQVNKIKKSEAVSYGATWTARAEGYVGVIPVGYSDGIPRLLSGNFRVLIEGRAYPVVGTVTMNYCMVWLGNEKKEVGTSVQLLSRQSSAKDWAQATGTIAYEILARLPASVPRTYVAKKC